MFINIYKFRFINILRYIVKFFEINRINFFNIESNYTKNSYNKLIAQLKTILIFK
jgi:hypothetical protein